MAIKIKNVSEIRDKWLEVTPGRQQYYEAGAVGAGEDWARNAAAAASAFQSAITAGNIGQMYKGGIARAGAEKYNRKVKDVGVARFSQGVQAAGQDFEAGFAPFAQTIGALTLTARQPRGSEANLARVREVAVALNKKRLSLRAAGG